MSMIRGALRGAAAVAASLVFVGASVAQDGGEPPPPTPREVVEHCLHQMGDITRTTVDVIRDRTERGVHAIVDLAQNGADPGQIVQTGQLAKGACTMAAQRGQEALDQTLERCVGVLQEIDAPREAFAIVREARRRSRLAIGDALTACKRHINRAMARALGGGGQEEPAPVAATGAEVGIAE